MDAMRLAHRCAASHVSHFQNVDSGCRGAIVDADGSARFIHDMKLQCGNAFPASVGTLSSGCSANFLICLTPFCLQEEHVLDALRQLQCPLLIVLGTNGWCVCPRSYYV